ncbi:MAG: DNA recombination protein RmuC [Candidatus Dojkabacteria bacterium]
MNDSIFIAGILIVIIVGFSFFLYIIYKNLTELKRESGSQQAFQSLHNLSQHIEYKFSELNRSLHEQSTVSNKQLQQQNHANQSLIQKMNENNVRILQEVTEKLVKVEDTNQQVINFASQLQSLENILNHSKKRGLLGEYFLETMLANILPKAVYRMQYPFQDGKIVDAVIFAKDKVIPVDAKFSLESFNKMSEAHSPSERSQSKKEFIQDIKQRIEETSKYIRPEDNTIDVAFMFVPADGVYQEIITLDGKNFGGMDIVSYAYSRKVVIVSPTSFFAYLQTLLQALGTLEIESKLEDIIKHLNESSKYLQQFEHNMDKLGKNITTLMNSFNRASVSAEQLTVRIGRVTDNKSNVITIERVKDTPVQEIEQAPELHSTSDQ